MVQDNLWTWRKVATRTFLLLFLAIGLCLIVATKLPPDHVEGWLGVWAFMWSEIGIAFVVAAILGLTVDWALRENLVADAVAVSLGYLLPEKLKPELEWIYNQKFLATQNFIVNLEHEGRTVKLDAMIQRTLTNVSGERAKAEIHGGTEEWCQPESESAVTSCGFKQKGKVTGLAPTRARGGIGYDYPNGVELDPNETIDIWMSYSLTLPDYGVEILTYLYPIDRPEVSIRAPESIEVHITFAHRSKDSSESEWESGKVYRRLEGVLLPYQVVRFYWNQKDYLDAGDAKFNIAKSSGAQM